MENNETFKTNTTNNNTLEPLILPFLAPPPLLSLIPHICKIVYQEEIISIIDLLYLLIVMEGRRG